MAKGNGHNDFERAKPTTELNVVAKKPVSYTHLDVYKRQLLYTSTFGGK